jgi:flavin reductase (DIM6/NTAB) family NADH-FMN oxidoreductase RutF
MESLPLDHLFKGAMRRLASGVALVATTDGEGVPCGIAMTAFMSLSMEPPSMLLAINSNASVCTPLLEKGLFSVNILGWQQREHCEAFVAAAAAERFAAVPWAMHQSGVPIVSSAIATIICRLAQAEPFGSHRVIKGLVEHVMLGDETVPLTYVNGRYGQVNFDG